MDTVHFYDLREKGEIGDDMEYVRWAGEYETLRKLEKDYPILEEIEPRAWTCWAR